MLWQEWILSEPNIGFGYGPRGKVGRFRYFAAVSNMVLAD